MMSKEQLGLHIRQVMMANPEGDQICYATNELGRRVLAEQGTETRLVGGSLYAVMDDPKSRRDPLVYRVECDHHDCGKLNTGRAGEFHAWLLAPDDTLIDFALGVHIRRAMRFCGFEWTWRRPLPWMLWGPRKEVSAASERGALLRRMPFAFVEHPEMTAELKGMVAEMNEGLDEARGRLEFVMERKPEVVATPFATVGMDWMEVADA